MKLLGFAPDTAGGAYNAPPNPIAVWQGLAALSPRTSPPLSAQLAFPLLPNSHDRLTPLPAKHNCCRA